MSNSTEFHSSRNYFLRNPYFKQISYFWQKCKKLEKNPSAFCELLRIECFLFSALIFSDLGKRLLIKVYCTFQSFYWTCHPIFEETQLWWFGFGLGISQMLASWLQNRACFWQKGFCWLGTRTLKSIKKRRYLHTYNIGGNYKVVLEGCVSWPL